MNLASAHFGRSCFIPCFVGERRERDRMRIVTYNRGVHFRRRSHSAIVLIVSANTGHVHVRDYDANCTTDTPNAARQPQNLQLMRQKPRLQPNACETNNPTATFWRWAITFLAKTGPFRTFWTRENETKFDVYVCVCVWMRCCISGILDYGSVNIYLWWTIVLKLSNTISIYI